MVERSHHDSTPTEDDGLLDQLRREGVLGPFAISSFAGGTDIGQVRATNEDRWATDGERVFVLADGIGGRPGGDLAAQTAVDVALELSASLTERGAGSLVARVNAAVVDAGKCAGHAHLGTTLVLLAAHRNHVLVVSVGDSRAYRLRDGQLQQLTADHNIRNELLAAGVSSEVADSSDLRLDALTSHIGRPVESRIVHHAASYSVMAGDRFLLCSDGIHGQLRAASIETLLSRGSCHEATSCLLAAANAAGGVDNASAIVIEFASADLAS